MTKALYTCPCCGYMMFSEPPGSYDICAICFWEDDGVQLADPWFEGGANTPNLVDSQKNFAKCGTMEKRFLENVRRPTEGDALDPKWRPVRNTDRRFVTTPREIHAQEGTIDCKSAYYYWLKSDS